VSDSFYFTELVIQENKGSASYFFKVGNNFLNARHIITSLWKLYWKHMYKWFSKFKHGKLPWNMKNVVSSHPVACCLVFLTVTGLCIMHLSLQAKLSFISIYRNMSAKIVLGIDEMDIHSFIINIGLLILPLFVQWFMANNKMIAIHHPSYSLDLTSCDFSFLQMKLWFRGQRSSDVLGLQQNLEQVQVTVFWGVTLYIDVIEYHCFVRTMLLLSLGSRLAFGTGT
jgi:hypothetical protein